jgi:YbgC/YbaW family acyl-CoA thioester hydrolase
MLYEKKNVRVLPEDTDAYGRINWRTYLRYCEEGEAGIFEKIGLNHYRFYRERKISFPRRAATFEYCSQVPPDSLIDIESSFLKIGKTSFTLLHSFYKKNTEEGERFLAATAQVTAVAFDDQLYQKIELPPELKQMIKLNNPAEPSRKRPQCTR